MALGTVQDYITRARTLLLDEIEPYRYQDSEIVGYLNEAFLEIRRMRPDVLSAYFLTGLPEYSEDETTAEVDMDVQYRTALVYYICGQCHLRDEEQTEDSRASAFMMKFRQTLISSLQQ